MATVQAFIRTNKKSDKNGVVQKNVFIRFRLSAGRDIQLSHKSEIAIAPDTWDAKEQCIKKRILFRETERERINNAIRDRKYLILEIFEKAAGKEGLTSEWLETEIDKKLHPEKYAPETIDTLFRFIDKFIEDLPKRKVKQTNKLISRSIQDNYRITIKHLKSFAKSINKDDFYFNEINEMFYDKFIDYLQNRFPENRIKKNRTISEKQSNIKGLKRNTVTTYIRLLKVILNESIRQGYNNNIYNIPNLVSGENVDNVYLDENELQKLKDVDLSSIRYANIPYLEHSRDQFLLLAWTGSRFSDLDKIGSSDIRDGFITFRQQKTNNKVTIPLHPVVLEILEKYNYNIPRIIADDKFNANIRIVAKLAGIDTPETITFTRGGKLITEHHPKHELVSSHTGRRSFCTNMYKRGLPTLMIMSISGHTTETSFLKYIKVRQSEHAEMMKKAWEGIYK
ncbi:MAG: site-specific integrase [Prevotella sp.]|jgi:site-specific recombinase XerD|nr:site-specific integrase [Prevotella sp.]